MHLVAMHKLIKKFKPRTVILDPITNLVTIGSMSEVKSVLIRLIDFLQGEGITVMFTALVYSNDTSTQTDEGISSLVDAWIQVRDIEAHGERNRGLYIMKSRGMEHSNQVREFVIDENGIDLKDVYMGPDGVLIGSAREAQQLNEAMSTEIRSFGEGRRDREITRKQRVLEAQIATLTEEFESVKDEMSRTYAEDDLKKKIIDKSRQELSLKRSTHNRNGKRK